MKIFLSWSGTTSHEVAAALRDWLPSVIQSITPFVSTEMDKGARWSSDIARELDESSFGIICVTEENLEAPWILFEAGALSKSIDKANVCPFLFNIRRPEVRGPLLQFQSTIFEKEDVFKLLCSINKRQDGFSILTDEKLKKSFGVWWPHLETALNGITAKSATSPRGSNPNTKNDSSILEEILELVRSQQRILTQPDSLVPPHYFRSMLGEANFIGAPSGTDSEINNARAATLSKDIDKIIENIAQAVTAEDAQKALPLSVILSPILWALQLKTKELALILMDPSETGYSTAQRTLKSLRANDALRKIRAARRLSATGESTPDEE